MNDIPSSTPQSPRSVLGTTRRQFLQRCPLALGALAMAQWSGQAQAEGAVRRHRARAKRVIYLHMAGSPPQHDLFDIKPDLQRLDGTKCPTSLFEGKRLAFTKGHPDLLGSPHGFSKCGGNGIDVTDLMPHFKRVVDKVAVVRSMTTDQFNHAPAQLKLYTGSPNFGAASMGSWVTYGLGSENENLPGFVVLMSGTSDPSGGKALWSSGYLPGQFQGVRCRTQGDPILYVNDPKGMSRETRRRSLDALRTLNQLELERAGDPETFARIEQYELAYRMQMAVPEVMNIGRESEAMHARYGTKPGTTSFANNCLLARRLVEHGVRFVQLFDWGWDVHGTGSNDDLVTQFPAKCRDVDQPIAALIEDLEQRGLLDDTLVVWGGEFGRTAMREARNGSTYLGRDHHPDCFTIWMAGGGIKPGLVYGATDELGHNVVEDPMTVHDLQATILHLLGFDPLTYRYRYQGLDQRLIGPAEGPRVHHALLA